MPLEERGGCGLAGGLGGVLLSMANADILSPTPKACLPRTGRGPAWRLGGTGWLTWPHAPPSPHVAQTLITQTLSQANPTAITAEEYFNPNFELGNRDMGRPMELTTKTQK